MDVDKTSNSGDFIVKEKKKSGEKDGKMVCERQQS